MGVRVKVLDPTPDCPASIVAEQMLGSFRDPAMIRFALLYPIHSVTASFKYQHRLACLTGCGLCSSVQPLSPRSTAGALHWLTVCRGVGHADICTQTGRTVLWKACRMT